MGKQTFTTPLYERDIQAELGLSMPDPVEARKTVYQFFDAYRTCKRLLGRELVAHIQVTAVRGYAFAMDPDDVRVSRVHGGMPRGFSDPTSDEDLLTPKEKEWLRFVRKMDERVNRLKASHSCLIRYRFLDNDPLPSDEQTFEYWYNQGWPYSFRQYERSKREAVQMIAAGLDADS